MGKDPAILFYTSDFLSGTAFFTMEQRGQYMTLLCEQHQLGHIPEDHMIFVCSSCDSPVIKKFVKDENGFYYNERMERETVKRTNYCKSRGKNRSGKKKKTCVDSHVDTCEKHMSIHMENRNRNRNKDKDRDENGFKEVHHSLTPDEMIVTPGLVPPYVPKKVEEKEKKVKYAENVSFTEKEHAKLLVDHGEENVGVIIEMLDNYKGANGKRYKSDYRAVLNWVIDSAKQKGRYVVGGKTNLEDLLNNF